MLGLNYEDYFHSNGGRMEAMGKKQLEVGNGQKSFPQVALRSYLKLKEETLFLRFTQAVLTTLHKMLRPIERAKFIHEMIDHEMSELYRNEAVQRFTACQKGCSACCHTQVSVTSDEADLLATRVMEGAAINWAHLHKQKSAGDQFHEFMKISFQDRGCVFLKDDQTCGVYEDRPSVCRTNAVVGTKEQCDTQNGQMQTQQILNTYNADMIIMGAYINSVENGTLPTMLWKKLHEKSDIDLTSLEKRDQGKILKEVFNTKSLG